MLFLKEVLQALVIETAGIACVTAVIGGYWAYMTKNNKNRA